MNRQTHLLDESDTSLALGVLGQYGELLQGTRSGVRVHVFGLYVRVCLCVCMMMVGRLRVVMSREERKKGEGNGTTAAEEEQESRGRVVCV